MLQFPKPVFEPTPQPDFFLYLQWFSRPIVLASANPMQDISAPESLQSAKAFPPSIPKEAKDLLLSMADEVRKNGVVRRESQLVQSG